MFVDLRPFRVPVPTYDVVIEEVTGISRTFMLALLSSVLREFKYSYADKRGEEHETYTLVDLRGVPAQRVGEAAEESYIPYVELVKPPEIEGLDTEGMILPGFQRMKLRLDATPAEALPLVRRIKEWATERDWSDVRLRIEMPENRSRVVSIAREVDAADVLFAQADF
jgi:hypothetical protein